MDPTPLRYLSATTAARACGITRDGFYRRLRTHPLPPDAMVDDRPAWLPETITAWDATIPARGGARPR